MLCSKCCAERHNCHFFALQCSQSCDKLHESRSVACSSSTGKIYLDDRCAANKKPEEEQPCSTDYHCKPQARWLASQWTEVS